RTPAPVRSTLRAPTTRSPRAERGPAKEERMELVPKKRLHLISGRANLPLAEEIAADLGVSLGDANLSEFANGELHCRFGESIRGTDVFIVQSHGANENIGLNDALMEQLIMVDAAQRASAKRITVVCP